MTTPPFVNEVIRPGEGRVQAGPANLPAMPAMLYTIGYERHPTPEWLTAALTAARVKRLVDVRELAISRRQGFAKRALSAALAGAGIDYEHHRSLGNPKPSRDLCRSGRQPEGEPGYLPTSGTGLL